MNREKLDAWLTAQGKTPSRYLRLRYCGAHLDDSSTAQTKQPNRKVRGGLTLKQLMEQVGVYSKLLLYYLRERSICQASYSYISNSALTRL